MGIMIRSEGRKRSKRTAHRIANWTIGVKKTSVKSLETMEMWYIVQLFSDTCTNMDCFLTSEFSIRSGPPNFGCGPFSFNIMFKNGKWSSVTLCSLDHFFCFMMRMYLNTNGSLKLVHEMKLLTGSSDGSGRNSASSPKIKSGGNSG